MWSKYARTERILQFCVTSTGTKPSDDDDEEEEEDEESLRKNVATMFKPSVGNVLFLLSTYIATYTSAA